MCEGGDRSTGGARLSQSTYPPRPSAVSNVGIFGMMHIQHNGTCMEDWKIAQQRFIETAVYFNHQSFVYLNHRKGRLIYDNIFLK
jgi:hypothetical protein